MKKLLFFIMGFLSGMLLSFCLIYLSGYILENFGVITYESESDQQRNFNIFIISSALISFICGCLSVKLSLTKRMGG